MRHFRQGTVSHFLSEKSLVAVESCVVFISSLFLSASLSLSLCVQVDTFTMTENSRNAPVNGSTTRASRTEHAPPREPNYYNDDEEERLSFLRSSYNTSSGSTTTYSRVNWSRLPTGVQTSESIRVVAVRYFLDRPGYGLHNSAMRLWWHPPAICDARAIQDFLQVQGIALPGLLVELYLDQFRSFMSLEACQENFIEWDFTTTSAAQPGHLNVRLTDLALAQAALKEEETLSELDVRGGKGGEGAGHNSNNDRRKARLPPLTPSSSYAAPTPQLANVSPSGLFSFSMMIGLEAVSLFIRLVPNNRWVTPAFYLTWGQYMFFVGGVLQFVVGIFEVLRNNVYGATAFMVFGTFMASDGSTLILKTYFATPETVADDFVSMTNPVGDFVRILFVFGFVCGLEVQTFTMNKLSSALIFFLCVKLLVSSLAGFDKGNGVLWTQFVFDVLTSSLAFYIYLVEFTNQVYHREVFSVWRWSEEYSPEEVFGAAGRTGTLQSKAARLRQAHAPTPRLLREATKIE